MRLFIRMSEGHPVDHPIMEDNFKAAFPDVDIDNLPAEFCEFERIDLPDVGVYQVYDGVIYQCSDGICRDVHQVRDMTDAEIVAKQQHIKDNWSQIGYPSWVFDVSQCLFLPPVDYPNDGGSYKWDEATTSWVAV